MAATVGAVGCNIGATAAYAAGAYGGRGLVERWGRYVLLNPDDLDRADRFFQRFGGPAVLIGRLLPVVRSFIALPAGIARMPQAPYQIYTFVGSWPGATRSPMPAICSASVGRPTRGCGAWMHRFDFVVIGLLVLGFAWFVWRHVRRPRQEKRQS